MDENTISKIVVDQSIHIHRTLGPGLLESVYERALQKKLLDQGLSTVCQVPIPVHFEGLHFEIGFRADIIVDEKVILEIKSVDTLHPVHSKQLLTYLKMADKKLGMLINFGADYVKDGIKRVVNRL